VKGSEKGCWEAKRQA